MAKGGSGGLKVLVLVPFAPRFDSPHGGRATAEFLVRLARRHHVGLVCLREAEEPSVAGALSDACAFVEEIELPERRRGRLLAGLLRGMPMQATEWRSRAYAERARVLAGSFRPDVVHLEPLAMAQYLVDLPEVAAPNVLVMHEPVAETARQVYGRSHGIERIIRWIDLGAWRRFEPVSLNRADAVVVLTERDRRMLETAARRVVEIPLGVEIPPTPLDAVGSPPPRLLFVGGYGHPPNVDAALRLADSILPRVLEQEPAAVLYLVGDRPPAALRQAAGDGVVVTGRVADVRPFLDEAAVVVAPLRLGGGMRNKVLEALAAGKAVVASPLAAEGVDTRSAQPLRLAESDAEFASAIVELLRDEEARRELAARARAWAETHLGWDERVDAFEQLYESLLHPGAG